VLLVEQDNVPARFPVFFIGKERQSLLNSTRPKENEGGIEKQSEGVKAFKGTLFLKLVPRI